MRSAGVNFLNVFNRVDTQWIQYARVFLNQAACIIKAFPYLSDV